MDQSTLTRRELYDLVWSKPALELSPEIGVSVDRLRELCDRHRVPVPTRGYWTSLQAGKRVQKALFVEIDDLELNTVTISALQAANVDQRLANAQRVPRAREPKIREYRFQIADWGWLYHLKSDEDEEELVDAEALFDQSDGTADDEHEEATEILDIAGTLTAPTKLRGKSIRLLLWLGANSKSWKFGSPEAKWTGWLHLNEQPIGAEASMGQFSAMRLVACLSAQKPVRAILSVVRDNETRGGIVGVRFEAG